MNEKRTRTGEGRKPPLTGRIESVASDSRGIEIVVRLSNGGDRALHYISDVRTVRYDPAAKRLAVGLSDAGRVLIAGLASVHPKFNYVDPHSEAELKLRLPPRIVKIAPTALPDDLVSLEAQDPGEADEVVVAVAWSDRPFYEDPRPGTGELMPTQAWALGEAVMSFTVPRDKREPKPKA